MIYRRLNDSRTWHWCRNCTHWPEKDYCEQFEQPDWHLCKECKQTQRDGKCDDYVRTTPRLDPEPIKPQTVIVYAALFIILIVAVVVVERAPSIPPEGWLIHPLKSLPTVVGVVIVLVAYFVWLFRPE